MSSIFDKHGHLSQSALQALKTGTLSEDELQQAAAHLADCESCANAFAGCFDTDELAEVPSGFADEVESKLYRKKKDNIQFIFYSIRVAAAACITLAIVFSGALNFIAGMDNKAAEIKPPDLNFVYSINTGLQDFSQKLLNMEVFRNEKEKK